MDNQTEKHDPKDKPESSDSKGQAKNWNIKKTQEGLKYFFQRNIYKTRRKPFSKCKSGGHRNIYQFTEFCWLRRKFFQNEIQVLILLLLMDPNSEYSGNEADQKNTTFIQIFILAEYP